ncbi:MAG: hypothetical protein ACLPOO_14180 [Terriglobales bacterium]
MPIFVERYLLPVLAALTVIVAVTNPMKWGWQPRITGGLAVCITAYLISRILHRHNLRARSKTTLESREKVVEQRVMIPAGATPSQIMSPFLDGRHTNLEATRATGRYVGKWMRFSGNVADVSERQLAFTDATGEHRVRVFADFDGSWTAHLEVIPMGQGITVIGRVSMVSGLYMSLDQCEIVN